MATLNQAYPCTNEPMRLLINVFVATIMLLGSLAAPCIAAPLDHDHANQVSISAASTSGGHHRSDGRFVSGTHCQQDGIVAQVPDSPSTRPIVILFGVSSSVVITGILEPVEQRPPIAFV
ncbi:hypothetical protein [Rhizobium leguminosarum]|uniref:hypothetical protein n=1 Tax=Rhizobium leguminosarum TaxID=384 RepID=UPI0021BBB7B5|nr:hypothetical protein [Rhizobium leguminosarum]